MRWRIASITQLFLFIIIHLEFLFCFRIEAASDDSNLHNRVTQLCFLHNCGNFLTRMVPLTQTGLILPRNLKNALADSLVDVTLLKLYPNLYNTLLDYVQVFFFVEKSILFQKFLLELQSRP